MFSTSDSHSGNGSVSPARLRVVAIAESEEGQQDPAKYWRTVLPEAQRAGGFPKHWCGGFALWCLHQAGLGRDINWQIGKGFAALLPATRRPEPGDVAYIDLPYQHHAIVAHVYETQITTVDGNQTGNTVQIRTRPRSAFTSFYSIRPLLERLELVS